MPAKRKMDVEMLLQWAYSDELSKREISSAAGIMWGKIGQGQGVDSGQKTQTAAQRYPHFGTPHPDAEAIERFVAKLPDADFVNWGDPDVRQWLMGDYVALVDPRNPLLGASYNTRAWVTQHAANRTRPPWDVVGEAEGGRLLPHRVSAFRGSGPALVGSCTAKNLYSEGSYCPLRWEPAIPDIASERANYAIWHDGLIRLVSAMAGQLAEFEPLPPACSPDPWRNPTAPRRVLPDLIAKPGTSALPLRWPRPAKLKPKKWRLGQAVPRIPQKSESQ